MNWLVSITSSDLKKLDKKLVRFRRYQLKCKQIVL